MMEMFYIMIVVMVVGYKTIHVSKLIKPYSKISGLYVNYFGKADFEKIKSNLFLLAPSFIK